MQEEMCLSLQELLEALVSGETRSEVGNSSGRMLAELFRERSLSYFAQCIREWVLVGRSHLRDWKLG